MRLLTIPQPEAVFTVFGARIYHPMPVKTDVPQLAAIHAPSAPASWAEIERRARRDKYLRRCLYWFRIKSPADLARLGRGAIVGVVRVAQVLEAKDYDDPPLVSIGGKPYLWRLQAVRAIVPVENVRARPNFWAMPEELVRRVESARDNRLGPGVVPDGLGREVYPRGDGRWAVENFIRDRETWSDVQIDREAQQELETREPLYWSIGENVTERKFERELAHYLRTHETRGQGDALEVKVDRRIPLMAELFPDTQWVTPEEFERRVRREVVQRREQRADDRNRKIQDAEEALAAARAELARLERDSWVRGLGAAAAGRAAAADEADAIEADGSVELPDDAHTEGPFDESEDGVEIVGLDTAEDVEAEEALPDEEDERW